MVFFICCMLMLVSAAVVYSFYKRGRKNEKEVGEVIREAVQEPSKICGEETGKSAAELTEEIQIDFERLREINTDIAGWIVFHNQRVNHPLVQTDDNSYYLTHSFRRAENRGGSIFLDCRNSSFEDRNVVVYGYNIPGSAMFISLKDVFHKKCREEEDSDLIYLFDTDHRLRKYKIFSRYIVEKKDYCITTLFRNDVEYAEFLGAIQARGYGETAVAVTPDDHILTLSTCVGVFGRRKKVVHAKLL